MPRRLLAATTLSRWARGRASAGAGLRAREWLLAVAVAAGLWGWRRSFACLHMGPHGPLCSVQALVRKVAGSLVGSSFVTPVVSCLQEALRRAMAENPELAREFKETLDKRVSIVLGAGLV